MTADAASIAVFALAVALLGLSKGGLSGIGALATPLMLLVLPPAPAAGLILPVLIIQDAFSLWLYRGQWSWPNLRLLLPSAAAGVILGFALFAVLPSRTMLAVLGAVTLAFAARGLLTPAAPRHTPRPAVGVLLGTLSGFTSTVLHQGGPPFQIYLLPQRLPRDVFVGTGIVFFAALNLAKVPGFVVLGTLGREEIVIAALAAPFALLMTWVGARITRMLEPERFYALVHWLLVLVGAKLLADAFL